MASHQTEPSIDNDILALGQDHAARDGEILIRQDDTDDLAYSLLEGKVEVYIATPGGDVTLAMIEAPAIIGEIAALSRIRRTASVRAAGPVRLKRIAASELRELGQRKPEFLLGIIEKLGHEKNTVNRAISLYVNALEALERNVLDANLLESLSHPPAQLAVFSSVFSRFANEISAKRKTQEELASAAMIQRSFLPRMEAGKTWPGGLGVEALMRPARHVGGDFYDLLQLDSNRLLIVVGDVCGKGMPASLFMAVVITTLRSVASQSADVATIAATANALLSANNERSLFATAVIAILDTDSWQLAYANCGHCPILRVGKDGTLTALGKTGLPLGLFASKTPGTASVALASGDRLLFYSDGITEAVNPALEEFGAERLESIMQPRAGNAASEIVQMVVDATDQFAAGAEQADDITCLAIAVPG